MATDFLREKLNIAQNMVRETELQIFATQMTIEEAAAVPEDANLQKQAETAKIQQALWNKKHSFRKGQVALLEKALQEQTEAAKKA